jgi:Cu/Ag efflux protein CusF
MKTQDRRRIALLGLTLLLATASRLAADGGTATATGKIEQFEGTVKQVNATEKSITVKNFWVTRTFDLSDACRVTLEDSANGGLKELQPGHRVNVQFVNHDGVRIAREIDQENLTFTGHISSLDATNKTFRVKTGMIDRTFSVASDCKVILRDGKTRDFAELKIGHRVTVKYLNPDDVHLARTIEQKSLEYTGRVDAIDARTDTVKASSLVANRTFRLADNHQIIVAGAAGGELKNLRIGDRVTFHYENVDGVLVANRLELATAAEEPAVEQLSSRKTQSP